MKIYLDNIIFSSQVSGGISVYWKELLNRILKDESRDVIIIEQEKEQDIKNIFRKEFKILNRKVSFENKFPLWSYRFLPLTIKLEEGSLFHSSYYRISCSKNIKNIVTVHDFTHEYFFPFHKKFLNYWKKKIAIMKADGIICISENTKKDLLKFHPWSKDKKIKVIYNGVGEEFYLIDNIKKEKNILFVGSRVSYKNFDIVIEIIKKLVDYNLIIVGGGELTNSEKTKLESCISGRYKQKLSISSEELNIEYNKAFCLVYPSIYEGFGIPILEAMKAGCPVIAVKKSSIPEVAGKAALLVDNISEINFIKEIKKLEIKKLREDIIKVGLKQANKFSWDKTYKELIEFYEEFEEKEKND